MSTIASRAKRSLALLERLIELLKKPGQESIGLFASEAVDALDRFRIWASNIGAFQDINVKSSLEYRIRDAPKIANQITELLGELIESLEDIYSIASHARENRTGALHEAEIDPSAHLLEANEDTQIENSDEEELSEVREILASIEDAISNLFRFSIIIRNNTSRDRYAKAATAAIATPFNGQFDICHVEHKFPALAKRNCRWLIERLGKAVTQRREYLKYCREHHDKTATEPQRPEPGTLTIPPIESSSQIPARSIAVARSDYSKPTSTLAPTQASTLILTSGQVIEEELEEEAQSQTSYATSTDEDSSDTALSVINLEEVSKGFKQFECPYCWQIQTARSQNAWKKHVLSDLKPYVCTFEKCELKLFSDRHTWFSHELKDHRQEWRCYFCSHHPFNDADKYKRHLASHHSDSLVQDQFSALLEMSQNALAKFSPTDCPFCDDWERRLRIINPHIPIVEALAVTPSQFQRHLGAHMEQLALFAIPRGYTEEGEADSGNAAPQVDSNSSFGNSRVSSNLGWQLRLCEDIMNALTEYTHVGYLSEPTALPPFYLWIPPCGQVKILPLSIPKIVQKLESGEYQEADDLYLDMQVLFAILDLTHETGDHANIRSLFDALWADRVGNVQKGLIRWLVLDPRRIRKQICWKLWTAKALSTRHIDTSPSAMIVTMKMLDGEQVTRSFDKAASMEYLYMFADCYELIGVLPNLSLPILEEDYQHDFHFMLNLAGDTSTSGRCRLDPRISIGQITEISTDFVVLDLGAKQRAELGRTFFEPLIEEKGKSVHVVTGHKQTTRVKENMEPPCVDAEEQQMAGSAIETRHDSEGTIQDLTNMEPDEEWSISAVDKEDSDSLYSSLDKDKKGYVTDIEASKFLYAWGISEDILGQIWALLDIKSTGYLTRDEFRVAMYLCRKARQDNGESLPKTLPLSLILPSMRRLHHLSAEFDEKQDVDEDEERWQNSPGKEIRLSSVNVNTVGLSSKYLGGRLATSDRPIPPDTQQVSPISEPMSPILDEGEVPTPPIGAGKARADSFLDSESESRDSAISNESIFPAPPTDYVDADYWTKEQVTYFLTTHVFSDDWQRTIRALEITGSDFLNLGRRLGLKDGPHLMHSKVFPRLASECKESGRGWNEDTEREEGKRLRRLIRGLVAETKQVAENNLSVTPYPKVSVVLSDNAGDRKTYGTLRKGDIVTFIRAEPSDWFLVQTADGDRVVPPDHISIPAPPSLHFLPSTEPNSKFKRRVLACSTNFNKFNPAQICVVELILDSGSDLNWVSEEVARWLEADIHPLPEQVVFAALSGEDIIAQKDTTLFLRDSGGGRTRQGRFCIAPVDMPYMIVLGRKGIEKLHNEPSDWDLTEQKVDTRSNDDSRQHILQPTLAEHTKRRNEMIQEVSISRSTIDTSKVDTKKPGPFKRVTNFWRRQPKETPLVREDLGYDPRIKGTRVHSFGSAGTSRDSTPPGYPVSGSSQLSLGHKIKRPGADPFKPRVARLGTEGVSMSESFRKPSEDFQAWNSPRLSDDYDLDRPHLSPTRDDNVQSSVARKTLDQGNRRRVAKVLNTIGDYLGGGAAGDKFDDSEFRTGNSLGYPEILGEHNITVPAEALSWSHDAASSSTAQPKDDRPTVIISGDQYACSACFLSDNEPLGGYVCGHLVHKSCYEKASGCPICLERRGAWRDNERGNYPTGYLVANSETKTSTWTKNSSKSTRTSSQWTETRQSMV